MEVEPEPAADHYKVVECTLDVAPSHVTIGHHNKNWQSISCSGTQTILSTQHYHSSLSQRHKTNMLYGTLVRMQTNCSPTEEGRKKLALAGRAWIVEMLTLEYPRRRLRHAISIMAGKPRSRELQTVPVWTFLRSALK